MNRQSESRGGSHSAIQKELVDKIAMMLLEGKISERATVAVELKDDELKINC